MFQLALDADALAVGLRLDGNALKAGLRMAWPQDPWRATDVAGATATPALHREGEFTFSGGGRFPAPFARAIAESAVRSSLAQMRDENPRTTFDPALVDQFIAACDAAAAQVAGASVIQLVGGEQEGVFTNHFLAVRVASAETFTKQIAETVRLWNELSASAQPSTKSEFEVQQVEIGGHKASQYTLDIAASEGLPDEPTLRQAMERLFGPDRKLHRFAVQFDEHTVLLAGATSDQVASAVRFLKDESPATWNATNVAISNHSLPEKADWKLFLGPNGYTKWLNRTSLATHGDVIGAPPQQIFPPTPPLGFAGSFPAGELSIEFRVPEETLRAGHLYWVRESTRRRAGG
jgi:hypothetical protein